VIRVFEGVFENLRAQNVVFCVVNGGGFMVKVWWERPRKGAAKNLPHFQNLFLVRPAQEQR
jgi:hypothetical protein